MGLVLLAAAVAAEVTGTLCLRVAALGRRSFYVLVAVAYVAAFVALSGALAHGVPLGAAYGVWTAAGVALTAVASKILFGEPLTPLMAFGIAVIVGGVVLVHLGSTTSLQHDEGPAVRPPGPESSPQEEPPDQSR